jgi:copper(I)-binding protein
LEAYALCGAAADSIKKARRAALLPQIFQDQRAMTQPLSRRRVLQSGIALCTPWLLPESQAHEIITSTLRITHPWSRATAPGDPFAVLCMKFDEVAQADRLILVQTPVAESAEMGGARAGTTIDFAVPAGEETYLGDHDAGTYVRLLGLKAPIEVGRSYRLVLGFEKGGTHTTTFSVDFTRPDDPTQFDCSRLQRPAPDAQAPNHPGAQALVQRIMKCAGAVTNK